MKPSWSQLIIEDVVETKNVLNWKKLDCKAKLTKEIVNSQRTLPIGFCKFWTTNINNFLKLSWSQLIIEDVVETKNVLNWKKKLTANENAYTCILLMFNVYYEFVKTEFWVVTDFFFFFHVRKVLFARVNVPWTFLFFYPRFLIMQRPHIKLLSMS